MDIVSSFIKQFNLDYSVVGNTITFIPNYFNSLVSNLQDITKYIIPSTIKRSILKTPKELKIGYTIDENDRLLNEYRSLIKCAEVFFVQENVFLEIKSKTFPQVHSH